MCTRMVTEGASFVIILLEVGVGRIQRIWALVNPDELAVQ